MIGYKDHYQQFPWCCAFSIIGDFTKPEDRTRASDQEMWRSLHHPLRVRDFRGEAKENFKEGKEEFQKEVLKRCSAPSHPTNNNPPAGSFIALNGFESLHIPEEWLTEIGFVKMLRTTNPETNSIISLYYRPHPDVKVWEFNPIEEVF